MVVSGCGDDSLFNGKFAVDERILVVFTFHVRNDVNHVACTESDAVFRCGVGDGDFITNEVGR